MRVSAILIDDEPKALAILKNKLERFCPQLQVVATTQNPLQAKALIEEHGAQIVFMDIAMPKLSGFDVLKSIEKPNFELIFATAFDQYAIDAINHCAIGYLVKPIDNGELIRAVDKAIENISKKTALLKNQLLVENLGVKKFQDKKIIIPTQEGLEFAEICEIIHCRGTDGYTVLYFQNGKTLMSSYSIGHFHKLLMNHGFYLIHKSHLINLSHIHKYLNEGYVILNQNHKLPVSRNRRADFLDTLKNR